MSETQEWVEFLKRMVTRHLIVDLGVSPQTYSNLEDSISISTSTLSEVLKAGLGLGMGGR